MSQAFNDNPIRRARFADPERAMANHRLSRRALLRALAGGAALFSGCGGGGSESSNDAAPAANNAQQTFLGDPAGRFSAVPDRTTLPALTTFSIITDATAKAYDYLAVAYALSETEYYVDYPLEPQPGQLLVTAPVGLLKAGSELGYGEIRLAVVRIAGNTEDISNVTTIRLEPPPTPNLPSKALAGALLAGTGALRTQTLQRAWTNQTADPDLATLSSTNTQLYSSRTVLALDELFANAAEERIFRQYLGAVFSALGLDPAQYITLNAPRAASFVSAKAVLDGVEGFAVDLDRFVRDLGDKVRSDGKVLQKVGSLIGAAGTVALIGGASPAIATAAIGVGATMAMVGFTTGLVEGFLFDNLSNFGGLSGTNKLDFKPTLRYWYDSASSYFLSRSVERYLPRAGDFSGGTLRERVGAFAYEVSRSQVLGSVRAAAEAAVERGASLNLAAAVNNVQAAVSSQWSSWSANRFSPTTFPSTSYRSTMPSPTPPLDAPRQPCPYGPGRCSQQ